MTGETALAFVRCRIRLDPNPEDRPEDRRLQRGAMQERGIHASERFQIRGLFTRALPFFIMAVVTLLAFFGSNEYLFDLLNPIRLPLAIDFLRNGSFMIDAIETDEQKEQDSCGDASSDSHTCQLHQG